MRFRVVHTTTYSYSDAVFLEPHAIRLRPRSDPAQRELAYCLEIEPAPVGLSHALDSEGNSAACSWFEGLTARLEIVSRLEVETLRRNPFDFLWTDGARRLGFRYSAADALARFLRADKTRLEPTAWALARSGGDTLSFLMRLNECIYESLKVVVREEGEPYRPAETLQRGEGACRDLAVLFCACCRQAGLAARFVSGYHAGDAGKQERRLHAWAEVYLPGGGWRGFDPTEGLAAADRHIALAAAAQPADAAAVSGSFRKTGATCKMSSRVKLERTEAGAAASGAC